MGIYVNNKLNYVVSGAKVNTSLTLSPGTYDTVVQEWDYCGGSAFKHVQITVGGSAFTNLQASGGGARYSENSPEDYNFKTCGGGGSLSINQGKQSPSLNGRATQITNPGTNPQSADFLIH